MARQRLGVVLLVPQPLATEIDGVRRALGDGALGRIDPHITLVPPVNVNERDMSEALRVVREAASSAPPLTLDLGPVRTFAPVNPVVYLAVGGPADELASLREACLRGPLERQTQHDFVPHVTLSDELAPTRIEPALAALSDLRAITTMDRVHVLHELPGRIWRPISDAPLGERATTVGRGSLALEISTSGRPDVEAAALLAVSQEAPGLPFSLAARREGGVVGAAWGWTAGRRLEVADLAVAPEHRDQGIGRHLIKAVESLAQRRECTVAGVAAPSTGAAAALLTACGWRLSPDPDAQQDERRRFERRLPRAEAGP